MALTTSVKINGDSRVFHNGNGSKLAIADVTLGSTSDYSSGLTVTAAQVGLSKILDTLSGVVRTSSNVLRGMQVSWNPSTEKLQIFQGDNLTSSTDGPLVEISGTALAAGDIVRVTFIGV